MVTRDVPARIAEFNADRDPLGRQLKYQAMALNPFGFFRGSCHLFYEDLPQTEAVFSQAPIAWICGDLHLQNFGSYKGEDRLVYFDINDFDEGVLAPCTWDLARLLSSIFVAAESFDLDIQEAQQLGEQFLNAYTQALSLGKARTIHRETATGLVKDLLEELRQRDRGELLDKRTEISGNQRQLKRIDGKTLAISGTQQIWVRAFIDRWAKTQPDPEFYEVLDVVHRIAGNGSLGLERYLILVEGKGSPNKNYLLDLKAARASSLQPFCQTHSSQTHSSQWPTQADRIVCIQQRFQESPPALLHALHDPTNGQSYVLRELQPSADKIDLEDHGGKFKRFSGLVQTMAQVTAWGQLRSSGRQGSAIADDFIAYAQTAPTWQPTLLKYAATYAHQVRSDHQAFQQWQAQQIS